MIELEASEPDSAAEELLERFARDDLADELENLEQVLAGIARRVEVLRVERLGSSRVDEAASARLFEIAEALRSGRRSARVACERLREGTT